MATAAASASSTALRSSQKPRARVCIIEQTACHSRNLTEPIPKHQVRISDSRVRLVLELTQLSRAGSPSHSRPQLRAPPPTRTHLTLFPALYLPRKREQDAPCPRARAAAARRRPRAWPRRQRAPPPARSGLRPPWLLTPLPPPPAEVQGCASGACFGLGFHARTMGSLAWATGCAPTPCILTSIAPSVVKMAAQPQAQVWSQIFTDRYNSDPFST